MNTFSSNMINKKTPVFSRLEYPGWEKQKYKLLLQEWSGSHASQQADAVCPLYCITSVRCRSKDKFSWYYSGLSFVCFCNLQQLSGIRYISLYYTEKAPGTCVVVIHQRKKPLPQNRGDNTSFKLSQNLLIQLATRASKKPLYFRLLRIQHGQKLERTASYRKDPIRLKK